MSAKQAHYVRKFFNAIDHPLWTVKAISRVGGRHETWSGQTPETILEKLPTLGKMNLSGCDIFIQAEAVDGLYRVINVDDIAKTKYKMLLAANACAIVQTSKDNLQGWFCLSSQVPKKHALQISQHLCATFQGDRISAANVDRAGRMPGFSNCKPGKPLERGKCPFVVLLRAMSREIRAVPFREIASGQPKHGKPESSAIEDRSHRDFAIACRMAESGAAIMEIEAWLAENSEKGISRPDYCQLTAVNAYNHVAEKVAKCGG